MKKFILTENNGMLSIDRILFESYYPILFTCKNEFNDTFICVCCQHNQKGIKWLIGKTENACIVQLLKDKITIRDLLLNKTSDKICVDYIDEEYIINYPSDWKEYGEDLPKEDSYMYVEPGEYDEDIAYFSENEVLSYNADEYEKIVDTTSLPSEPKFVIDECLSLFSVPFDNNIGCSNIDFNEIILELKKENIMCTNEICMSSNDISYRYSKKHNIVDKTGFTLNTLNENDILSSNALTEAA